jgi:hypothetical protein
MIPQPTGTQVVQKDDLFAATIGVTYYYRVAALDSGYSESLLSPEVSVLISFFNVIALLTPTAGVGDDISISGENFGVYDQMDDRVEVPGVVWEDGTGFVDDELECAVTDWQVEQIDAAVPNGATTGQVAVTIGGATQNTPEVFTNSDPYITAISQLTAQPRAMITLTGNNFGATFDATHRVVFDDVELLDPNDYGSYSNEAITFRVPDEKPDTYSVTVRVDATNSNQAWLGVSPPVGAMWQHTWGADGAEAAVSVATDSADNIYLAGGTSSAAFTVEADDVLLVCYDTDGTWQWSSTWDNSDNAAGERDEKSVGICIDENDQLLVTGDVRDTGGTIGGTISALYIAYANNGAWSFARKWVSDTSTSWGRAIACNGSDVFIAGIVTNGDDDVLLLRYDNAGAFVSAATWTIPGIQEPTDIIVDGNGDLIIVGTTENALPPPAGNDAFILKVTSDFTLLWANYWGGGGDDSATAVTVDSSDNIYVTGGTASFGVNYQPFVIMYNTSGVLQDGNYWPLTQYSYFTSIDIDSAGKFLCSGSRRPIADDVLYALLETDYSTISLMAYGDPAFQPGGMSGLLDGNGDMLLCGDATSLGATWADVAVQPTADTGTSVPEAQALIVAAGASSNLTGLSNNVVGTEDTGDGLNDMLIIKYNPE